MWSQNRDDCSPDRLVLQVATANYDLARVDCPFAHPYFWTDWVCQGKLDRWNTRL
jgi:hypothetical protein